MRVQCVVPGSLFEHGFNIESIGLVSNAQQHLSRLGGASPCPLRSPQISKHASRSLVRR